MRLLPILSLPALLAISASASLGQDDRLTAHVEAYLRAESPAERRAPLAALEGEPIERVEEAIRRARPARTRWKPQQTVTVGGGTTTYRLVIPPDYDPSKRYPLLLAVHGSGADGSMEASLWRSLTDARGWVLACPDGDREGSLAGWGSSDEEREHVRAVLEDVRRRVSVDPDRVVLTGVSRGGHASWEMGTLAPDLWAGIAPRVGGPRLFVRSALENLVPVPVHDVQGAKDQARLVDAVREACTALRKLGGDVTYVESPDLGHTETPAQRAGILDWAATRERDLDPRKVVLLAGKGPWRRAFWVQADRLGSRVPDARTVRPSVQARPGAAPEDLRRAFIAKLAGSLGRVEARVETGNRIIVRTKNVTKVTLYLSPRLLDLDRPITVVWNGRPKRRTARPSVGFLLEHVRETGDVGRLYAASITVP